MIAAAGGTNNNQQQQQQRQQQQQQQQQQRWQHHLQAGPEGEEGCRGGLSRRLVVAATSTATTPTYPQGRVWQPLPRWNSCRWLARGELIAAAILASS